MSHHSVPRSFGGLVSDVEWPSPKSTATRKTRSSCIYPVRHRSKVRFEKDFFLEKSQKSLKNRSGSLVSAPAWMLHCDVGGMGRLLWFSVNFCEG